jgi:hypothetical protein
MQYGNIPTRLDRIAQNPELQRPKQALAHTHSISMGCLKSQGSSLALASVGQM